MGFCICFFLFTIGHKNVFLLADIINPLCFADRENNRNTRKNKLLITNNRIVRKLPERYLAARKETIDSLILPMLIAVSANCY